MTRTTLAAAFAVSVFLAAVPGACAADAPLIPVARFDPAQLLPPPPKDGSPAAIAELDELHRIEATRTAQDFARAKRDDEMENPMAFATVMGPGFDLVKLPQTAKLLRAVRLEEKLVAKRAKNHFRRNRPWIVDPNLKACATEDAPQSSYPSGHSTMGYSMAVVLAALAPAKAPAIMARAADFAENRLVCSMHFRRDIVAGETLGTLVGYELLKTRAFKLQFAKARAELAAAHVIAAVRH